LNVKEVLNPDAYFYAELKNKTDGMTLIIHTPSKIKKKKMGAKNTARGYVYTQS